VWALVSFAAALGGVALNVWTRRDRHRTAQRLEAERPITEEAASRAQLQAMADAVQVSPPSWDQPAALEWATSQKAKDAFKVTQAAKAAAGHQVAAALGRAAEGERALRASLAADLRGGLGRDAAGWALIVIGAISGTVASVT
jgi:hypothetical protein